MPLLVTIFLLLFGGLQALLLVLFLIKKKLYRGGYIFLLLYLCTIIVQIAMKVIDKLWLMNNMGVLYETSYFLPLLYGPLLFLFTRQVLTNRSFRSNDLLHFLPFTVLLVNLILHVVFSSGVPVLSTLYQIDIELWLLLISVVSYHVYALQFWNSFRRRSRYAYSERQREQLTWIRQFIISSFVVCVVISVALYLIYVTNPASRPFRVLFSILTVFVYWVSYTALSRPAVFSVVKGFAGDETVSPPVLPALVVHRPVKKYSNSGLTNEDKSSILALLQKTMVEQKPYLDPGLTINDLTAMAKCNRHQLSQVLNETLHQSFYDYVNSFRVEEARLLLTDPSREEYKISSIAYDAGFNSLSTFNDVFKKVTGVTPSQYKKHPVIATKQRRG